MYDEEKKDELPPFCQSVYLSTVDTNASWFIVVIDLSVAGRVLGQ
jgi:hypothetical protein